MMGPGFAAGIDALIKVALGGADAERPGEPGAAAVGAIRLRGERARGARKDARLTVNNLAYSDCVTRQQAIAWLESAAPEMTLTWQQCRALAAMLREAPPADVKAPEKPNT